MKALAKLNKLYPELCAAENAVKIGQNPNFGFGRDRFGKKSAYLFVRRKTPAKSACNRFGRTLGKKKFTPIFHL
ncbi:MAG: hypothetical protein L6V93_11760 [Clostridiales bacterium]|nr:MAG: hypothetical protein L6V93_11760 [Clostridiales bacterium]